MSLPPEHVFVASQHNYADGVASQGSGQIPFLQQEVVASQQNYADGFASQESGQIPLQQPGNQNPALFVAQNSPQDVIRKIEHLIQTIIEALSKEEVPILTSLPVEAADIVDSTDDTVMTKRFNISQCRVFTSILLVLSFVYNLLQSDRTTTTREVYYFYVTHFRSQSECDAAIRDAANMLRVPRHCLGLTASPKGWFCGSFQIIRTDGSATDGTRLSSMHGLPITSEWIEVAQNPHSSNFEIRSNAKCILIVEKEGVYNRLSEDRFFDRYPCVLVTGKGFPDLATRALTHVLYHVLRIPVYCLTDCNPFGVGVMQTYLSGSRRMGLDGGERYSVPVQWIGLRPSHVEQLRSRLPSEVLQQQTELDQKRLQKLCHETNPFLRGRNGEKRLDELLTMQARGYKVELEALHWLGMEYFCNWVHDILVGHESVSDGEEDDMYII